VHFRRSGGSKIAQTSFLDLIWAVLSRFYSLKAGFFADFGWFFTLSEIFSKEKGGYHFLGWKADERERGVPTTHYASVDMRCTRVLFQKVHAVILAFLYFPYELTLESQTTFLFRQSKKSHINIIHLTNLLPRFVCALSVLNTFQENVKRFLNLYDAFSLDPLM
jgi:hypothetical protein